MWPSYGIEPREGAELSKRVSDCQRSSQGAQAPQRSARAERGRDSLPRHLELTRTSAKGSFSFIEGSAEIASRNPASEWDVLSFCGLWRKLRPRSRAQNGIRFPARTSDVRAHLGAPSRARSDIPPAFAPLCRPFGRLSARAGILKTILFLCNTMQARPARSEGGSDGEDTRR